MAKKAKLNSGDNHVPTINITKTKLTVDCSCGKWNMSYNFGDKDTPDVLNALAVASHKAHVRRAKK